METVTVVALTLEFGFAVEFLKVKQMIFLIHLLIYQDCRAIFSSKGFNTTFIISLVLSTF